MNDIRSLHGVGESRAKLFAGKGIETAEELLYYFPRTHEDRTKFCDIADSVREENVCIRARVFSPVHEARIKKNFNIYSMIVFDDSGSLTVKWFNNRFVKGAFRTDEEVLFFGRVTVKNGKKELLNPVFEKADKQRFIGRIVPIYPLTGNLTQKIVSSAVEEAFRVCGDFEENIPRSVREKFQIAEINFALKNIHFPENAENYEKARRRFVFEELFYLQTALFSRRASAEEKLCEPFADTACVDKFIGGLPFELTGAQKRVISEICTDFKKSVPMNRLLQGDVGSGKTAVAAAAVYAAYRNGRQSAVMAPTEILAVQHYETFSAFFKNTDIKLVLLTSGTKNKKSIYADIANGVYDVIIGTNAVIQKDVVYKNLGLAITDEQHRFGVAQRALLTQKGDNPNTLIMTATPIPRTLSLILYGDLDISVIDELPPGRKTVETYAVGENMRRRVYAFLEKNVRAGSQAYVVCPLIEESEKTDLANASDICARISDMFPNIETALLHGRMKPTEKERIMRDFADGKTKILVSTTVIEVGVNVPGSNVMIIENAERFGLSALHQLRGRVGRGKEQAYCILIAHGNSGITQKRMETLCKSNDGFYIAEQDLQLRGPGDYFGTRQHGLPEMHIANLFSDTEILKEAQSAVRAVACGELALTERERKIMHKKTAGMLYKDVIMN